MRTRDIKNGGGSMTIQSGGVIISNDFRCPTLVWHCLYDLSTSALLRQSHV